MGRLGFPHILGSTPCPERDLCMAMIAARILFPGSKLATSRALAREDLIEPSLFDEKNLAEISSPDFPGERLVVCRNPLLAYSRKRKREDLLQATEKNLRKIQAAVARSNKPLRGRAKIGLQAGRIIHCMALPVCNGGHRSHQPETRNPQALPRVGFSVMT